MTFWGGDFVTGMSFGLEARRKVSLFVGPSFKKLRQAFDIFAHESNRDPNVNYMTLKEELKASYYGGVVGIRLEVPFKERWKFTLDGELGDITLLPHMRDARERPCRRGNPMVDVSTDSKRSDSDVAVSFSFQPSLSITFLESLTFQVGAGIEYLSRVPVMRYASLGENFQSGVRHAPVRIAYSRAFGVLSTFSITYEF